MNDERVHTERGSTKSVWDAAASHYDAERSGDAVYLSCIDRAAGMLRPGADVSLDAGCGTGFATALCVQRSRRVVAMDFSHASLAVLRARRRDGAVEVLQGDLTALPFRDGTFDQVLCANTLQHLRHGEPQRRAIAELRRVTVAGGRIVVSVHHFSKQKQRAGWIKEGKPGQAGIDYIFRFTRADLVELIGDCEVTAAGFYELKRLGAYQGVQNLAASLCGAWAARHGYGHMLIAVTNGTGRRA